MKLVSIIIPVYQVEDYLEECLDSVLMQTYTNLQIIVIDDESLDRCPEICDNYKKKDKRIEVIHQKNRGAAGARNAGLDIAKGDYICFVDSDDIINANYVESLVRHIEKGNVDIAVCSYVRLYTNRTEKWEHAKNQIFTKKEYLQEFLIDWSCGLIWNKIFKKEVIEGITFEEGHKIDDEFFTYQTVLKSDRILIFDEVLIQYRMRKSGVMQSSNQYRKQIVKDRLEYLTKRYDMVVNDVPELKKSYLENYVENLIRLWRESAQLNEVQEQVKEMINRYKKEILLSRISIKLKYGFLKAIKEEPKEIEIEVQSQEGLFQ